MVRERNQPEQPAAAGATPHPAGMPRWVKVSGLVAAVVLLLLVVTLLFGGKHGPYRHLGGASAGSPPSAGAGQPSFSRAG